MAHPFVSESHVFHRTFAHKPETLSAGAGIKLVTEHGREIYDASAGPAVSCLGHTRPEMGDVASKQIKELAYVYSGSLFTSKAAEDLATHLLQDKPGGLSKAIFVNSGSEATDAALKLALQYWKEIGQPSKQHFIARKQSYHGNTLGALSISGHRSRRELYLPSLAQNVSFVDPCFSYRFKPTGQTDEEYVACLGQQLEDEILRVGPENVAAFVAETVSGTTLGCATAVPGYFQKMRSVCDRYGVLLILDEIMCGMGKTGTMHAWEQEGIRGPDLQMIGKALGGGFLPLSGVLVHGKIFEALVRGSGGLAHGHTFQAHPVACATALEVQRIVQREHILSNVRAMGQVLERLLTDEILPLPLVGHIRGRGLFWSVEFMLNGTGDRRVPMPREAGFGAAVVRKALELGLNVLGNLGDTGEVYVDHVILSPPYVVTERELGAIVGILREAVGVVTGDLLGDLVGGVSEKREWTGRTDSPLKIEE